MISYDASLYPSFLFLVSYAQFLALLSSLLMYFPLEAVKRRKNKKKKISQKETTNRGK